MPARTAASQAAWSRVFTSDSPQNRTSPATTYDRADGYLLLFGGTFANKSDIGGFRCYNDTWTFANGVWTNLSIPGPAIAGCGAGMTYDAADGYVVLFGGLLNRSPSQWFASNETWRFSHGHWAELTIPGPAARDAPEMAYDPTLGQVVLWGGYGSGLNDTWAFSGGVWTEISVSGGPSSYEPPYGAMSYSGEERTVLLVEEAFGPDTNATWELQGSAWVKLPARTPHLLDPDLGYDSIDGLTVLFGGTSPTTGLQSNDTWVFGGGVWQDLGVPGPPVRQSAGFTFDAIDGGMVLFGGWQCCDPVPLYSSGNLNDTWEFGMPPANISLSISVRPASICIVNAPGCPAGTTVALVSLSADVIEGSVSQNSPTSSTITYGPYHWLDLPRFVYVPWENISVVTSRPISVSCGIGDGPYDCPKGIVNYSTATGVVASISWIWNATASSDVLRLGDHWSSSFYVEATGVPNSTVPVDACVAAVCLKDSSNSLVGAFTTLDFEPFGNSTLAACSFPPALVSLLAVESTQSGPPSSAPPPPPGVGAPVPAPISPLPSPIPVSSPVVVTAPVGSLSVSLQATAVGLIAAGLTRVAIRCNPQAMRIPIPLRVRGPAPETPQQPQDPDWGDRAGPGEEGG